MYLDTPVSDYLVCMPSFACLIGIIPWCPTTDCQHLTFGRDWWHCVSHKFVYYLCYSYFIYLQEYTAIIHSYRVQHWYSVLPAVCMWTCWYLCTTSPAISQKQ